MQECDDGVGHHGGINSLRAKFGLAPKKIVPLDVVSVTLPWLLQRM